MFQLFLIRSNQSFHHQSVLSALPPGYGGYHIRNAALGSRFNLCPTTNVNNNELVFPQLNSQNSWLQGIPTTSFYTNKCRKKMTTQDHCDAYAVFSREGREHEDRFLVEMEAACASGDLTRVQTLLQVWHSMPHSDVRALHPLWRSLRAAIDNQRLEVIAYLMDNGVYVDPVVASAAVRLKSIPVFLTLLDHGWDINQTGRCLPALTYVSLLPIIRQ